MDANLAYRSLVLSVAERRFMQHLVTTRGWRFARRFVAGTEPEQALQAVDDLEKEGVHGILDLLGEMVENDEQVQSFTAEIVRLVQAFGARPYPRYVSVKLTQLGLDFEQAKTIEAMKAILDTANHNDCFIRIDMEDSPRVDATIDVFKSLRKQGYENVGLVLQSYLHRTEKDLESLLPLNPNLRIVKGAYMEPASVAFQDKNTVDENYKALVQRNLSAGNHTAIGTHDERIIAELDSWIERESIDRDLVEYQMLYGIRRDLQKKMASEGKFVRAYVPYGSQWYPYFSRRIAERPANALFVLKALLAG